MNNKDTVIAKMTRLLKLSEPNENGVAMHGHWIQYRSDFFQLFKEMADAGLDIPEDTISDKLALSNVGQAAMKRWTQDVMPAWNEWRYVLAELRRDEPLRRSLFN